MAEHHHLALIRIAVEDQQKLGVTDIEFKIPRSSYTIDTLIWLSEKYPNREFILISGTDIFLNFHKWKNYKAILEFYAVYVYPRLGTTLGEYENHPSVKLFPAPMMEISSSFIRKGIKAKKNMRYWMSDKVYDYMQEMHFYKK